MEKEVMTFDTEEVFDAEHIPSGLFHKKKIYENLHDQAFETKPISYLRGAMMRFAKNKASIVAAIIIALLALYAIIVPLVSPMAYVNEVEYKDGFVDDVFKYSLPYNPINKALNLGWWDGTEVQSGKSAMDLEITATTSLSSRMSKPSKRKSSLANSRLTTNSASTLMPLVAKNSTSAKRNIIASSNTKRSRASIAPIRAS